MSEAKKATEPKTKKEVAEPAEETVTIVLPVEKGEPATRYVSCNGIEMTIERGVPTKVPKCIYEVITNSQLMEAEAMRRAQGLTNVYLGDI